MVLGGVCAGEVRQGSDSGQGEKRHRGETVRTYKEEEEQNEKERGCKEGT